MLGLQHGPKNMPQNGKILQLPDIFQWSVPRQPVFRGGCSSSLTYSGPFPKILAFSFFDKLDLFEKSSLTIRDIQIVVNSTEYSGKDSMMRSGWSATENAASIRPPENIPEGREEWTFFRACLLLQCCDGPFPERYSKLTKPFVEDLILLRWVSATGFELWPLC